MSGAKGSGKQDQSRPQDSPAGKPAARRRLAVQQHIDGKKENKRKQHPGHLLEDQVRAALHGGLFPLHLLELMLAGVLPVPQQQDHHRRHRQKQHAALPQSIEAAVADNHGRHHVLRARLLFAVLQISLRHLVVDGVVFLAESGHVHHCGEQDNSQRHADHRRGDGIPVEKLPQPVLFPPLELLL
ncbi:Uncharacterised protein [uncultured Blautia sp.]|nr:Uncharacterised protein [uncultured Blautia sp.]